MTETNQFLKMCFLYKLVPAAKPVRSPVVCSSTHMGFLSSALVKGTALVYFSGPWEHVLALWQYFKLILFQITNKTNLT